MMRRDIVQFILVLFILSIDNINCHQDLVSINITSVTISKNLGGFQDPNVYVTCGYEYDKLVYPTLYDTPIIKSIDTPYAFNNLIIQWTPYFEDVHCQIRNNGLSGSGTPIELHYSNKWRLYVHHQNDKIYGSFTLTPHNLSTVSLSNSFASIDVNCANCEDLNHSQAQEANCSNTTTVVTEYVDVPVYVNRTIYVNTTYPIEVNNTVIEYVTEYINNTKTVIVYINRTVVQTVTETVYENVSISTNTPNCDNKFGGFVSIDKTTRQALDITALCLAIIFVLGLVVILKCICSKPSSSRRYSKRLDDPVGDEDL